MRYVMMQILTNFWSVIETEAVVLVQGSLGYFAIK